MTAELDIMETYLIKVRLMILRLMTARLIMRLGRKVKKHLSLKNLFKFKKSSKFKKMFGSDFLILKTKLAFTKLKQALFKTPILHYFDPKHHDRHIRLCN